MATKASLTSVATRFDRGRMAELEELKAEPDEPTSLLNRIANVRLAGRGTSTPPHWRRL
jgi:hypothetical protein